MWLSKSSIGRKVVMSLSGLFLIIFLLFHASMNMVAVFSKSGYDLITEFLGTNAIVQFMVPVLALGVIIHVVYAVILTHQNRKARGNDRYDKTGKSDVQWAAKNMFVFRSDRDHRHRTSPDSLLGQDAAKGVDGSRARKWL